MYQLLRGFSALIFTGLLLSLFACETRSSPYVAFSLREAAKRAQAGMNTSDLQSLGGMTRIVGMVHTSDNDIVLVGRALPDLSGATLSDLVVALKARLVHDQWPTVDISPTADTHKTGLQKINFSSGLSQCAFGETLLNADVFLKNYSLEIYGPIRSVKSYRSLCTEAVEASVRSQGCQVIGSRWVDVKDQPASITGLYGHSQSSRRSYQTRFWFTPLEPYHFVGRDGVFCIKELRLVVRQELIGKEAEPQENSDSDELEKAGERFVAQFGNSLPYLMQAEPSLRKLKILYDLVAVAEGIRNLKQCPDLSYLLNEYEVKPCSTPDVHEFRQLAGFLKRSDGQIQVIGVSGGVQFKTELEWLNDGDVSPLKEIITQTRPSPNALSWELPLSSWQMPNSQDLETSSSAGRNDLHPRSEPGCSIFTQSAILGTVSNSAERTGMLFKGFSLPPPTQPLSLSPRIENSEHLFGGVSMKDLKVGEESFVNDPSGHLRKTREEALGSRPNGDCLSWPLGNDRRE